MSELKGIYAMWYRELKVFFRERSRIVASIFTPILWLIVIGAGLGSAVSFSGVNYQAFIYPGILIQSALFSSIFFGIYIVWDKKIDFLKEVLVAPMSRTSIFIGKALGGATDSMIQTLLLLGVGFILMQFGLLQGVNFDFVSITISIMMLLATIIGLVSLGLAVGSQMESFEGFQLVSSFVIFPMFFLSGALFPVNNLPQWLSPFVFLNPLTYSVDGLRGALLGLSQFPIALDFAVVTAFAVATIIVGAYSFGKMKI